MGGAAVTAIALSLVATAVLGAPPPAPPPAPDLTPVQQEHRADLTSVYLQDRAPFHDTDYTPADIANDMHEFLVQGGDPARLTTRALINGRHAEELLARAALGPATHTEFGVTVVKFPAPVPVNDGHVGGVLDCLAHAESENGKPLGAGYRESGGNAGGRYQLERRTGQGALSALGYGDSEWYGQAAYAWPSWLQDTVAAWIYSQRGTQPWPPSVGRCG